MQGQSHNKSIMTAVIKTQQYKIKAVLKIIWTKSIQFPCEDRRGQALFP